MGYKMNGWSGYQSSPVKQKPKQKHEGAETMGSEQLEEKWGIEGLSSGTDYFIKRGEQGEPMILGEVELDADTKSEVTGVPGSKGGKLTRKDD